MYSMQNILFSSCWRSCSKTSFRKFDIWSFPAFRSSLGQWHIFMGHIFRVWLGLRPWHLHDQRRRPGVRMEICLRHLLIARHCHWHCHNAVPPGSKVQSICTHQCSRCFINKWFIPIQRFFWFKGWRFYQSNCHPTRCRFQNILENAFWLLFQEPYIANSFDCSLGKTYCWLLLGLQH